MKWVYAILAFVLLCHSAQSQTPGVTVVGPVNLGHCASFASTLQLQDAGISCAGGKLSVNVNPYTPSTSINPGLQPFDIEEVVTGTCTTGTSPCFYNDVNIGSDNAVIGSGTSGTFTTGVGTYFNHNIGGATMTGNRAVASFNLLMNQQTGNTARGVSYSALTAFASATANDNGTDTGSVNSRGQISTINFIAKLGAGATDYAAVQGGEVDIHLLTGSSSYEKTGWQIVELSDDAVQGATWDAALVITNGSGAVGWKNGILFGGAQGFWPFTSSSTIITCASPCGTATSFIDMTSATFSGNFLKATGFQVAGTGVTTLGSVGGTSGEIILNGTTSGQPLIQSGATGSLLIATVSGHTIQLQEEGDGTAVFVQGPGSAIANSITLTGQVTGTAPSVSTANSADTNVNLNLVTKGSGTVQFGNSGSFTANGAGAAVTFGATTPAAIGTPATVFKWLTLIDNSGNTFYVPTWH